MAPGPQTIDVIEVTTVEGYFANSSITGLLQNQSQLLHNRKLCLRLIVRLVTKMMPPRIELGTFCVLGRCDNRYTMAS